MKSKILTMAVAALLMVGAVGCTKQKTCRCSVVGRSDVRIIKIEKGECSQLATYEYHNALDSLKLDSLLCTDYEFRIDSMFEVEN